MSKSNRKSRNWDRRERDGEDRFYRNVQPQRYDWELDEDKSLIRTPRPPVDLVDNVFDDWEDWLCQ